MKVTQVSALLGALLTIGLAAPAVVGAQDALAARKQNMKAVTATLKDITDQQRRRPPDWAKVEAASVRLSQLSKSMPTWFAGPTGGETKTKAEAFTDRAGFAAELKKFDQTVQPLQAIAKSKNAQRLSGQMDQVRESCVSCHNKYRDK